MADKLDPRGTGDGAVNPRRRRLLLKIGAASLAAYAAPTLLNLSGQARASDDRSDRSDDRRVDGDRLARIRSDDRRSDDWRSDDRRSDD